MSKEDSLNDLIKKNDKKGGNSSSSPDTIPSYRMRTVLGSKDKKGKGTKTEYFTENKKVEGSKNKD